MRARLAAGLCIGLMAGCSQYNQQLPVCNTLVVNSPIIDATAMAAAAPPAVGGTLAEGNYQLSSITLFTGPNGSTTAPDLHIAAVVNITGNVLQQANFVNDVEARFTSLFTASGTTLSIVDTCPGNFSGRSAFSATATSFSIYVLAAGGTREQVYTLRPAPSDGGVLPDGGVDGAVVDGGVVDGGG